MTEIPDLMDKLVSLCKRRGFVFPSSEIYGGLRSCYDYGPLGAELKRNVKAQWWRAMVTSRDDIVGIDASIIMSPQVWKASGHLAGFSDPMVDCKVCKERFRADKAPRAEPGGAVTITLADKLRAEAVREELERQGGVKLERHGRELSGAVAGERGYVCPVCGSPFLSAERQFNLMFRTSLGSVDPVQLLAEKAPQIAAQSEADRPRFISELLSGSAVYLRPETAQAMFVNFLNVQAAARLKLPFGIAQQGKSFRNEITVEHFIYRSCEFEQMELEFFCRPGTDDEWLEHWKTERMRWYRELGIKDENLRLRAHEPQELAHYAKACFDVEYRFPWGWGELEGIANRTDYDLRKHAEASGQRLAFFDEETHEHIVPYVIEPAAGCDRTMLVALIDAYDEDPGRGDKPVVLRLSPRLAPIKAGVFPLVKKDGMPEISERLHRELIARGISAFHDVAGAIGRRYARQDEVGTPWCITIDGDTIKDQTVTLRERDSMKQERVAIDRVAGWLLERLT